MVRLEDIHTLVCDGYNDGQEGHWGYEWMCGIGMRHLVSLYYNNLYFSLFNRCYILRGISSTYHMSTAANKGRSVLFMHSGQGRAVASAVPGLQ